MKQRWAAQRVHDNFVMGSVVSTDQKVGLDRCAIIYINLDRRDDRRTHFESQADALGVKHHRRFEAVRALPGGLGCSLSHEQLLKSWRPQEAELLMVCEDDALFVASRLEIDTVIDDFAADPRLSVLALGNKASWQVPISNRLAIATNIQTTACYVIKPHAIPNLIQTAEESVRSFRSGRPYAQSAIDHVWKRLQQRVFFAVPIQRMVIQMPGLSDIAGEWRDYGA